VCTLLCIGHNLDLSAPNQRLLQPADVATFNPQKLGQKTAVLDWQRQNSYKILNKEWFAPVLDGVYDLYPLNPENLEKI